MSATIQYGNDDNAKKAPTEAKGYSEEGSEEVVDATAMSGTLETSGTTGEVETAEDVSPVFDLADEQAKENPVPEGTLGGTVDPAATGENALEPQYEGVGAESAANDFDASKDPGDYKVAEVKAFLANASDEDKKKVIAAEKKGENRKGIVEA